MTSRTTRRDWIRNAAMLSLVGAGARPALAAKSDRDPRWDETIEKGLNWLGRTQSSRGQWNTEAYPTAMAALAGTAMIASGSTTTQGPYAAKSVGLAIT